MQTFVERNVGPVRELQFQVPEHGGVVVLNGRNGLGKSLTLDAASTLATGKGKIPVRNGALNAEVSGFGVTIKMGRRMSRDGELQVVGLEGRLSIAELVDPGIASPDAADARRIKALITVTGAKADPSLFYDLLGGREQFDRLVKASSLSADDPVKLAAAIKRDLEEAARQEESQAEHAAGHAKANKEIAERVDLTAECDAHQLQAALEAAIAAESRIKAEAEQRRKAIQDAAVAEDCLADAAAEYVGPSVEAAVAEVSTAAGNEESARAAVVAAKRKLQEAEATLRLAEQSHDAAKRAKSTAEAHERMIATWRAQVEAAANVEPISATIIADAAEAVRLARAGLEAGVLIREAKAAAANAERQEAASEAHRKESERLRTAARATEEVLTNLVAQTGCPLRVEAGRLVYTQGAVDKFFADLSHGERWKIAIDVAIEAVGEHGLLVIPQEAWEGLDPINRQLIADHVADLGVIVFTAEATEDPELIARVFQAA